MPTFEYQAQGADGKPVNGVAFGRSLDEVARDLASKGMQVTRIGMATGTGDPIPVEFRGHAAVAGSAAPSGPPVEEVPRYEEAGAASAPDDPLLRNRSYLQTSVVGPLVGKVGLSHLLFFFRQFSAMVGAGVPIVQSLDTLSRQARDPKLRAVVEEMRQNADAGRPVTVAMQRYPEVFSPVMVSLVRAGEEGGMLEDSLRTVADYVEREINLRTLYRRATMYPKIQIVASMVIILGANAIISSVGRPGSRQLWSPLTDITTWYWLGPLLVAIFLFLRVGLANPRVKYNWDALVLHVPYLGGTLKQLAMAKFGRAFGALYKGGVPVNRALTLAADACGNEYLRSRMYPAYRELEHGKGLTETFRATRAFSPIVLDMVHTGETTGNVDGMLTKMAEFYEEEGATRSIQFGQVFGVAVAILVAVYIGYVVISFYMGYFGGIMESVEGV